MGVLYHFTVQKEGRGEINLNHSSRKEKLKVVNKKKEEKNEEIICIHKITRIDISIYFHNSVPLISSRPDSSIMKYWHLTQ